jgi:hypothetical protein
MVGGLITGDTGRRTPDAHIGVSVRRKAYSIEGITEKLSRALGLAVMTSP